MTRLRNIAGDAALAVAFVAATTAAGATFARARSLDLPTPANPPALALPQILVPDTILAAELHEARDRNPFAPDRTRPLYRFELAAQPGPAPAASFAGTLSPALTMRLLGTTMMPGGRSFAVISVTGGSPQTVRTGEEIEGWTVGQIDRGRVQLTRGPDTQVLDLPRGT